MLARSSAARRTLCALLSLVALVGGGACGGGGGTDDTAGSAAPPGAPIAGLNLADRALFDAGKAAFLAEKSPDQGLGPVFNAVSCAACHRAGAPGGASDDLDVSRVTRVGAGAGDTYSDLTDDGGPTLQSRSLREFASDYPVLPETLPATAQHVSHRITTPIFGAGLIAAVPDDVILSHVRTGDPDGVTGRPNRIADPLTGQTKIGRFGWKAQHASLDRFAAEALLHEMGVTTPDFPDDLPPQGRPAPDAVPDPEATALEVTQLAFFSRFLAPPVPAPLSDAARRGANAFERLRCSACHVPQLRTGESQWPALARQAARLYSDLLLHDMGSGLADGVEQEQAGGRDFRTAPLWGLRWRRFYLHDGRASTIDAAVRAHGGEAQAARQRYEALAPAEQADVRAFLESL